MEKQILELENDRVEVVRRAGDRGQENPRHRLHLPGLELISEDRRLSLLVLVAGQPRVGFRLSPRQASDLMQAISRYLLELT